jgi:hypothetical protein
MRRTVSWMVIGMVAVSSAARGQARDSRRAPNAQQAALEEAMRLKESRYQIGQIERIFEGAVEHGMSVIRDRLLAVMPADMLLTENARARGFRLEGYGIFFDVEVPSLQGTLPWSFLTLNQNDLGVDNALQTLRTFVQATGSNDAAVRQALERIELQMAPSTGPIAAVNTAAVNTSARQATSAPSAAEPSAQISNDPILANPNEAYRAAIRQALIDAMLDHTRGLNINPNEWLTIAARSSEDRPRLAPADPEGQTNVLSIRGADLAALLAGQITREEAMKRVDIRVF